MMDYRRTTTEINKTTPKLRVKGLYKEREESLKEFLIKFFTKWNNRYSTVDIEDGSIQTEPGKRRSLGDIYKICKYYYPKCSLEEVSTIVCKDLFDEIPRFRSSHCSVINRRVFYQGSKDQSTAIYGKNNPDEFGRTFNEWIKEPYNDDDDDEDMEDE